MPKMKTHRGAAKRLRKTGTGKLTRSQQGKRHILTKKTTKRKRALRATVLVAKVDAPRLKQLVPTL